MLTFFSGLHSDQYLTLADPYFKTVDMSKQCGAYHERQWEQAQTAATAPALHCFLGGGEVNAKSLPMGLLK